MGLAEQLQEAVNSIPENFEVHGEDVWTDEEMAAFLEAHPMIATLLFEGFEIDEIMEAMDAGMMALAEAGNPGNDPFSTQPLHKTNSAGQGGGNPIMGVEKGNPRVRTGECVNCSCSGGVCTCTCKRKDSKGKLTSRTYTRTINMSNYYSSGRKAKYMKHWRANHGPEHPR
jgi:hypothetical protein